jgi:polyisoprenoid-binding protein YceI
MTQMIGPVRAAAFGLMLAVSGAAAQTAAPPSTLPPGVFAAERDIALATAGSYAVDPFHSAVLARVSHLGYSYLVFRFDKAEGTLTWDPAAVARAKLSVTVPTSSIVSNVEGFAAELTGDNWLKSKAFPNATFVSTAFRQANATGGKVDGEFTLMGKTKPVTFDVSLVGAGKGFMGKPRIGVHARGWINPQDFGLPALMTEPIEIVIDTEFEKAS